MFLLGADDPEMREIVNVLVFYKYPFLHATKDNRYVHPGNAYQADPIRLAKGAHLVLVECQPISIPEGVEVTRIDHHRPGDPGSGLPPAKFWQASSLGQLWETFLYPSKELYVSPSHDQLILAAMDHCPAAAIRGECPGVTARQVIDRKVTEIGAATKKSEDEVRERIAYYEVRLMDAPALRIGEDIVSDLRTDYLGEGYSLNLLAAQVAALAGGYIVLLKHRDAVGKEIKWSISGHATPQLIEAFMKDWAPAMGLTGIYGVPIRGYAGGYLPETNN
jgi:hypothetical protein